MSRNYYWIGSLIPQSRVARLLMWLAMWWDDVTWVGSGYNLDTKSFIGEYFTKRDRTN